MNTSIDTSPPRLVVPDLTPLTDAQLIAAADAEITQMLRQSNPHAAISLVERALWGSDRDVFVTALAMRVIVNHHRSTSK